MSEVTQYIDKVMTETLGFKKLKDEDLTYYEKHFEHPVLKGLNVMVDEKRITVYCKELTGNNPNKFSECDTMIASFSKTQKNLNKVLIFCNEKPL